MGHHNSLLETKRTDELTHSILDNIRVFVCACSLTRLRKLPNQLAKLELPYTLRCEPPTDRIVGYEETNACSRRFIEQIITSTDEKLLWLEDDIDVPYNFREIWSHYEGTLPDDWKIAVIGWGAFPDSEALKIRSISRGWWNLEGEVTLDSGLQCYAPFHGTHAVLFNSGDWRKEFVGRNFYADIQLGTVCHELGITQIYHTDRTLIGTGDINNVFGDAIIQHPKLRVPRPIRPRYLNGERKGMLSRKLVKDDFIGDQFFPITGFRYLPKDLTKIFYALWK